MQGKRHDLTENDFILEMGEYGKDSDGKWYMRPPVSGFGMGSLGLHTITEHEDSTITVSPSILCAGHHDRQWHGYLEKGIWREV
jgi:hypothetical protein